MPILLTQRSVRRRIEAAFEAAGRLICLDAADADPELASQAALAPDCPAVGDNLAYLRYTSGLSYTSASTRCPMGIAVTHRSVVNLLLAFADLLPLHRGARSRWRRSPRGRSTLGRVVRQVHAARCGMRRGWPRTGAQIGRFVGADWS